MYYFKVKKAPGRSRGLVWLALLAALAVLAAVYGGSLRRSSAREGAALLRQAVCDAAVTCYAVEGRYPPDLQYIIDRCGVRVDTRQYLVSYNVYGENLLPEVRVYLKGE